MGFETVQRPPASLFFFHAIHAVCSSRRSRSASISAVCSLLRPEKQEHVSCQCKSTTTAVCIRVSTTTSTSALQPKLRAKAGGREGFGPYSSLECAPILPFGLMGDESEALLYIEYCRIVQDKVGYYRWACTLKKFEVCLEVWKFVSYRALKNLKNEETKRVHAHQASQRNRDSAQQY